VTERSGQRVRGAALGLGLALLPLALFWGFTVDDALISARVAANIARGLGHRFNPDGPVVDAVTPLGFAWVLAAFSAGDVLAAHRAGRVIGALAWLAAAAFLGARIAAAGERRARFAPLLVLALSAPLAAWAASGMETGIVTALATFALARLAPAALLAGLAAAWRPELLPWALVLGTGGALARRPGAGSALIGLSVALAPTLAVALGRQLLFGSPTPLAAIAKPSDLTHGAAYAIGALIFTGAPMLVLAPWTWKALPGHERAVLAASGTHFAALVLAGGDWMVLYRLAVPVLPGLLLVGAAIGERAPRGATFGRTLLAAAASLALWVLQWPAARGVEAHRSELIERARVELADARRVAAVDVGWLGAATDAHVVDLAGGTDPTVARLFGGHTTKRIPDDFLRARRVDAAVLLLADGEPGEPWTESRFAYPVERRVARQAEPIGLGPAALVPLGGTRRSYLVLRVKDTLE
jgi:hypothetical protein